MIKQAIGGGSTRSTSSEGCSLCISLGTPIPPPAMPQWGPYGVWVPYPPAVSVQGQQRLGWPTDPVPRPFVFSRLNNGQSSSSEAIQGLTIPSKALALQVLGKAPMHQIYVPKKVEAPVVPPPRARP
jgi:hypothetical protein